MAKNAVMDGGQPILQPFPDDRGGRNFMLAGDDCFIHVGNLIVHVEALEAAVGVTVLHDGRRGYTPLSGLVVGEGLIPTEPELQKPTGPAL